MLDFRTCSVTNSEFGKILFLYGKVHACIQFTKRGMCIEGLFWPPLESKTENCFSQISFDWFIRRITEV